LQEAEMPDIRKDDGVVTQITVLEAEAGKQDELLRVLRERARFMATQPGFVSISLHQSLDGAKIINYVQWQSRELLEKAHHSPEFREKWPQVSKLTDIAEPNLYKVVHMEESRGR
jgi:heme-degrading monooxygenase HmoA